MCQAHKYVLRMMCMFIGRSIKAPKAPAPASAKEAPKKRAIPLKDRKTKKGRKEQPEEPQEEPEEPEEDAAEEVEQPPPRKGKAKASQKRGKK